VLRTVVSPRENSIRRPSRYLVRRSSRRAALMKDRGLESRFLTEEMGVRPLRQDIPINTPACFADEALALP